jgi:CBS domain containing-hemolysin-like protein
MTCLTLASLFLILSLLNTSFSTATRTLPTSSIKALFSKYPPLFFYFSIHKRLFAPFELQSHYFFSEWCKSVLTFLYAIAIVCTVSNVFHYKELFEQSLTLLGAILLLILIQSIIEILAYRHSKAVLFTIGPIASLLYLVLLPFAYLFLKIQLITLHKEPQKNPHIKKIEELLEDLKVNKMGHADPSEHKWIESVLSLKETRVREVMKPRIDLFALDENTSIKEALSKCIKEGYSRVPLYKEDLDHITGILMVKDILEIIEDKSLLDKPISTLAKKALFTPESKSISHLLQEFRSKHNHLAVVVDEYGGTKGVITIEDILEEIVGEIEDEYDDDEQIQFFQLPSGSYIVDSTMSINDVEEKLHIHIPNEGDYDSIGGYVFFRTGTIPEKGFKIENDDFEIEVLSSNDRKIEKVKLTARKRKLHP